MRYHIKKFISIILVSAALLGALCIPVASFENDVETSTADMILINVDTNTVVFSQKPDNKWYSGYLATLTVYLVACDTIQDPADVTFEVEQSFIDSLPYTDGCLDRYVGQTLTAKDLMAIMLLTDGSDAAYALVSLSGVGGNDAFTQRMNAKVQALGCKDTLFVEPGFSTSSAQHTTCRDLYYIYMAAMKTSLFSELTSKAKYTPAGLEGDQYVSVTNASILNTDSPFYFRYVNEAKYSYSPKTYECIALTTTYRGKTYFFAGLLGYNQKEKNVYADSKKLTTWAYLNLSDRRVIDADSAVTSVDINAGWGTYHMELHPFVSAYKTLPEDYEDAKLAYKVNLRNDFKWPLFKGHSIGSAEVTYDNEKIEDVNLVLQSSEGVDMLLDASRFGQFVLGTLTPNRPSELTNNGNGPEVEVEQETVAPTDGKDAEKKRASEKATEPAAQTQTEE